MSVIKKKKLEILFYIYLIRISTKQQIFKVSTSKTTMSAAAMIAPNNYRAGNTRYNQHRGARKATAYCKVCHDAGCPKSEYTSHFVRGQEGDQEVRWFVRFFSTKSVATATRKVTLLKSALRLRQKKPERHEYQQAQRQASCSRSRWILFCQRSSPSSP